MIRDQIKNESWGQREFQVILREIHKYIKLLIYRFQYTLLNSLSTAGIGGLYCR